MKTLHQRIEDYLLAQGAEPIPSKSGRYKCFELNGNRYWLGKAGAFRAGPTATGSYNAIHMIPAAVRSNIAAR
jgi:hypothetical protein